MAARNFTVVSYTLNRDQIELTGKCTGAGAANPTALRGLGMASIVRTGAGRYTITLSDRYAGLLFADFNVMSSTPTLFNAVPVSEAVNSAAPASRTVTLMTTNAAGTATDITTTETLLISLKLSNSLQTPRSW
jgi:hypothetical protein